MTSTMPPRPFRGMKTADDVMGRCILDDYTGCWHWQGAMRQDRFGRRTPAMYVWDTERQEFRTMTGPLAVLQIVGRRGLGVRMAWRVCMCDDCVNPDHLMGGTRKDFGRWIRTAGVWKHVPARVAANRRTARERSDLTPEIVAQIKASPLNGIQAAAEFGVSKQMVSKLRNGKAWADRVVPGASVFTLGARNA